MINKRLKDVLFTDQWSELCINTLSRFGYVLVSAVLLLCRTEVKTELALRTRSVSVKSVFNK